MASKNGFLPPPLPGGFFTSCCLALLTSWSSACLALGGDNHEEASRSEIESGVRLPVNVLPERYDLYFEPDFEKGDFEGSETILVDVKAPTSTISLNEQALSVYDASISPKGSQGGFIKADIVRQDEKQLLILKFPSPLSKGKHELSIKFSGRLGSKLAGFYLSTFKDKQGREKKIATTQMEPTDARSMFPCFDEPAFKARYRLSVCIPKEMTAVSNSAVEFEKEDKRKDKKVLSFKTTPPYSTYLFALAIGDFKASPVREVNGKKIRVYAVNGKEHLTAYALDVAARLLPYYESYFGAEYPLDKLDLIAIPDFSAGAMENPGAITFRETALLCDEKASTAMRMNVAGIIAHEMAHLWFGDLVTMKWWNGLWLNEAFATWMATKAVNVLEPQWRAYDEFALARVGTLDADGLIATRPVEYPVKSPEDAMEMFDEITYEKGGSLLKMLETYLGENTFQEGIKLYMKEHAFANATTGDLWRALSASAAKAGKKVDVGAMMNSWVFTAGCPLLDFSLEPVRSGKKEMGKTYGVKLSQRRYLREKVSLKGQESLWTVPLMLKGDGFSQPLLFSKKTESIKVKAESAPLFINGTGCGFFRTAFDETSFAALVQSSRALPELLNCQERISLFSDLFALAASDGSSDPQSKAMNRYLTALAKLKDEEDPYVLSLLIGQVQFFESFLPADEKLEKAYASFVCGQLKGHLERLGFERRKNDTELQCQLRGQLVRVLGTIGGDRQCIDFCRGLWDTYLTDEKSLDSDLLSAIVTVVAYNGDGEDYARILQLAKMGGTPESYQRNLGALTAFRGKEQFEASLAMVLGKDVRAQDVTRQLSRLLHNRAAQKATWNFLESNWEKLKGKLDPKHLPDLVEAASVFNQEEDYKQLEAFINQHPLKNGRRSAAKTLELVRIRIQFRKNALPTFIKALP